MDICRVAIQRDAAVADVALPAGVPVGLVIPAVIDIVGANSGASSPTDWRLSRVGGESLHAESTLQENGIRDGDLLMLTPHDIPVATKASDTFFVPPMPRPGAEWTPVAGRRLGAAVALWCSAIGSLILLHGTASSTVVIAAVAAGAALVAAIVAGRRDDDPILTTTLNASAIVFAAAGGYLAVPGEGLAPKLMLAAGIAATVPIIALRATGRGTTALTAITSFSALSTAAALACILLPTKTSAAGAVLAAASLALLALAARLAIVIARLPIPSLDDHIMDEVQAPDDDRTHHADAVLNGLVCGFCASAALGAGVALLGDARNLVLCAIVGVVLLLRARTHVGPTQIVALLIGGTVCLSALFVRTSLLWPHHSHWIGLTGAAATALCIGITARSTHMSPAFRRSVDITEYLALAALIPATCWACGVFGAVRGVQLT